MSETPYPPADQPADGDRSGQAPQRYSASASVPVPPVQQPTASGQSGPSASSASGQARVAATASVPVPSAPQVQQPSYGLPPQGYPAQPGVYGQPAGGAPFGQPAGGSGQFGPAPGGTGQYGQPPGGGQYASAPAGPGQFPPPPASPQAFSAPQQGFGGPAQATYGAPQDRGGAPAPMGQGGYAPATYGQPAPETGRPREGAPTGGWPYVENAPPAPKSRKGLIITLIAVAVALVVGVGGYVGWSLTNQGAFFAVGDCVKQDGTDAVAAGCSDSGAYRITSIVETENTCPDARQPSLVLTEAGGVKKFACLAPAG